MHRLESIIINNMKFAVMQPYFMPYIGYFQLMDAVDRFVIYDNIEFTKKGWIHRNRILIGGVPQYFTVNLEKGSDFSMVNERKVSPVFAKERNKILAKIEANYRNAPFYEETRSLIKTCFNCDDVNLFSFIFHSIVTIKEYLGIGTELIVSSKLSIDHSLKNRYKIWAFSERLNLQEYVNPIGGLELYSKKEFNERGVNLMFHRANLTPYRQLAYEEFVPALSIIDVLMNVGKVGTQKHLKDYSLI